MMRLAIHNRRWGRTWMWLLVGLLIGGAAGAGTVYVLKRGKAGIPGGPRLGNAEELAMVPADAVGFVHIRARDIWKAEEMADFRKVIERAGPEALKLIDDNFVPKPSSLDRATLVIFNNPARHAPPPPPAKAAKGKAPLPPPSQPTGSAEAILAVGLLSFNEDYDAEQVKAAYLPNAVSKQGAHSKEYWVDETKGFGFYFPNKRVMVLGMAAGVAEFVKKQTADGKPSAGALARPLALAAEGNGHIVGAVNTQMLPFNLPEIFSELRNAPPEVMQVVKDVPPILKAEAFAFAVGVSGDDMRVAVYGYYKTDEDAEKAEAAIRSVAANGRKALAQLKTKMEATLKGKEGEKKPLPIERLPESLLAYGALGGINTLDDILANPPLKRNGSEVVLSADKALLTNAVYGGYAAVFGFLTEGVTKVRDAAARMSDANNLKQLGIAMHNYHDAHGGLPPQDGAIEKGKGGLSWRVHILPYIEQDNLYRQFKLDEPWDSPNNKKLIPLMPKTYASPLAPAPEGQTFYKVFSGKDAMFAPGSKTRLTDITDGTSNTIMIIEGGQPVIWTKPEDISFDGTVDKESVLLPGRTGVNVCFGDGSVRMLDMSRTTATSLAAMVTRAGGEIVNIDEPDPGFLFPRGPGNAIPVPKGAVDPKIAPPPPPKGGASKPPNLGD
jgi:uncharacterized protein DUF1559